MKVLIDMTGSLSDSSSRGIGRYSKDFAMALSSQSDKVNIHILLNYRYAENARKIRDEFQLILGNSNIHYWSHPEILQDQDWLDENFDLANKLLETKIKTISPDIILVTEHFTHGVDFAELSLDDILKVICVYDVIPLIYPENYLPTSEAKDYYLRRLNGLKNADILLTISESSCNDIVHHLGCREDKVINIGCASSEKYTNLLSAKLDQNINTKLPFIEQNFFMYCGGFDQRKGVPFLIETFSQFIKFVDTSFFLVIVGSMPLSVKSKLESLIEDLSLNTKVVLLGYIHDLELLTLYKRCVALIHPSEYEGFGLPLLEAMSCGAPVISANNSSIPEVVGDAGLLFETGSRELLLKAMNEITLDTGLRTELATRGKKRSKRFHWSSVADKTINSLQKNLAVQTKPKSNPSRNIEEILQQFYARSKTHFQRQGFSSSSIVKHFAFSFEPKNNKRLLLDISILVKIDSKSGIQRVVRGILADWIFDAPKGYEIRPIYLCEKGKAFMYVDVLINGKNLTFSESKRQVATDFFQNDIFIGLDLHHDFLVKHSEIYNGILRSKCDVYFILYDLLPVKWPEFFNQEMEKLHKDWLFALTRCNGVIAISKTVLSDFERFIAENIEIELRNNFLLSTFQLGSDFKKTLPSVELSASFKEFLPLLDNKINILMVGTIEPRKGHADILNGFGKTFNDTSDVNFIIVGRQGWKVEKLIEDIKAHKYFQTRLFLFDDLSDSDLETIYSLADGYIAASFDEGYGLPIIEAASYNLPILARNIEVFKEVAGSNAAYFNSGDSISDVINAWVKCIKNGSAILPKGIEPVSWQQSASQLLGAIKDNYS